MANSNNNCNSTCFGTGRSSCSTSRSSSSSWCSRWVVESAFACQPDFASPPDIALVFTPAGIRGASAASEVAVSAASEVAAVVSSSPQHAQQAIALSIHSGVKRVQQMGESLSAPFTATREIISGEDGEESVPMGDRHAPRYLGHEQLPLSEIKSHASESWLDWQVSTDARRNEYDLTISW
jgi:hypothetical protein